MKVLNQYKVEIIAEEGPNWESHPKASSRRVAVAKALKWYDKEAKSRFYGLQRGLQITVSLEKRNVQRGASA